MRVRLSGGKIELEGVFESNPLLRKTGLSDDYHSMLSLAENLMTISPNGRWACSGSNVYDVATRKIVRKLPCISFHQAFSADGKTLYMMNGDGRSLLILRDWEKVLESPDK